MSFSASVSEFDFLAVRSDVAIFADPSVSGELERSVVFIAEERSGLATPGTSDDVRVAELGVGPEYAGGDFFLISDQIVTTKYFPGGRSNKLSAQVVPRLPQRSRGRGRALEGTK